MSKIEWVSVDNFVNKIKEVDDLTLTEIIQTIKNKKEVPYDFNYVLWTLEQNKKWYIIEGDLTLNKSFSSEYALIITGNLTINGMYDDFKSSYIGNVIVMGNMTADHIYSWGTLTVLGNIKVKGLIYNEYNDHVFETIGKIDCKAFYVDEKETLYNNTLLNTEFKRDYYGTITGLKIIDLFVNDVIDKDEEYYELNSNNVRNLLYEGRNIFKT